MQAASDEPSTDGATIFQARCARCNGETGETDTPSARALKVRPLIDDAKLAAMSPGEVADAIRSNPEHAGVADLSDLSSAQLEAAAVFVPKLATQR